jgi:hypothetical protein
MLWYSYHRELLSLAQNKDALTKSQKNAYDSIVQLVDDREQRINLWGDPGTGKTFVAHCLDYQAEGLYSCSTKNYKAFETSPNSVIIFDNAPHDRKSARIIFGDMLWNGAAAVILITRKPLEDAVRKVHLSLKFEEIEQVKNNIHKQLGMPQIEIPDEYHFRESGIWTIIKNLAMNG